MGRAVFTSENIEAGMVVGISPVIVMSAADRKLLDLTPLHDFIFEWGERKVQCCMALGLVPVYNHSHESNCEYEMPARMSRSDGDFGNQQISIKAVRIIRAGEELFSNYNGDWNSGKPLWFEVK